MNENVFNKYWAEVAKILGGKPLKGCAISVNENPVEIIKDKDVLRLYKSLNCPGWENCKGANWVWRPDCPSFITKSPEVELERSIIENSEPTEWMCQMSTSSGIQGPYMHKRRAIDLVRCRDKDCYDFIELKVGSDNPLYAAFEILGYALAYLQAITNNNTGRGIHDVMCAKEINLVVLGPTDWYKYRKRGQHNNAYEFHFDWLATQLEDRLNYLTMELLQKNNLFTASFKKFTLNTKNINESVKSILSL